jgi:acetate kinase
MLGLLLDRERGGMTNLGDMDAIGFKVVGANGTTGAVRLDDRVLSAMEEYNALLLRHNPPCIAAIRDFRDLIPDVPLVGLFETTFHRDMPPHAYTYGVPRGWCEKHGVRRYGYHGASFRYLCERVPHVLGGAVETSRLVLCHLGGSSSVCAAENGRSVDTSMGMSNQAGVSMTNRCGDVDPFVIPYVMDRENLTTEQIRAVLSTKGGLAGISGLSGDVRELEEAAADGHQGAALALAVYAYEVKKYIGAYAAALGGLDALVFAGGIGENGIAMRARICTGLTFLGIDLDPARNEARGVESLISRDGASVPIIVIPTNEEIIVARETKDLMT